MARASAFTLVFVLAFAACSPAAQEGAPPALNAAVPAPATADNDAPVPTTAPRAANAEGAPDPRLIEVARRYASFARVGDLALAPALCAAAVQPGAALMAPAQLSRAPSPSGHAEKVFWVYTDDRAAYLDVTRGQRAAAPAGMSVVKEAWSAERDDEAGVDASRTVKKGGHVYRAGSKVGLFLMVKVDPTPDTDGGWIYGTAGADGSAVRRETAEEACAGCHRAAAHDRIFGPSGDKP